MSPSNLFNSDEEFENQKRKKNFDSNISEDISSSEYESEEEVSVSDVSENVSDDDDDKYSEINISIHDDKNKNVLEQEENSKDSHDEGDEEAEEEDEEAEEEDEEAENGDEEDEEAENGVEEDEEAESGDEEDEEAESGDEEDEEAENGDEEDEEAENGDEEDEGNDNEEDDQEEVENDKNCKLDDKLKRRPQNISISNRSSESVPLTDFVSAFESSSSDGDEKYKNKRTDLFSDDEKIDHRNDSKGEKEKLKNTNRNFREDKFDKNKNINIKNSDKISAADQVSINKNSSDINSSNITKNKNNFDKNNFEGGMLTSAETVLQNNKLKYSENINEQQKIEELKKTGAENTSAGFLEQDAADWYMAKKRTDVEIENYEKIKENKLNARVDELAKKYADSEEHQKIKIVDLPKPSENQFIDKNENKKNQINPIQTTAVVNPRLYNSDDDFEIEIPKLKFPNKLAEHQTIGLKWLLRKYITKTPGCILADDMGLGKTIQSAALLRCLCSCDREFSESEKAFRLKPKRLSTLTRTSPEKITKNNTTELLGLRTEARIRAVLVVCPNSVMSQWIKELNIWCPELQVFQFHGPKRDRVLKTFSRTFRLTSSFGAVLITTYATFKQSAHLLYSINYEKTKSDDSSVINVSRYWDVVILDEAQTIKNSTSATSAAFMSMELKCKFKLLLTGTPLMNRLDELWALLNFISPNILGTKSEFNIEFSVPINLGAKKGALSIHQKLRAERLNSLRIIIAPFILRRTKQEVYPEASSSVPQSEFETDVESSEISIRSNKITDTQSATASLNTPLSLPPKLDVVVWHGLSDIQARIYKEFLGTKQVKSMFSKRKNVLFNINFLKTLCKHPVLLLSKDRQTWRNSLLAPHKSFSSRNYSDKENHDNPNFEIINMAENELNQHSLSALRSASPKLECLYKLLPKLTESREKKVLIFSDSTQMLDLVECCVISSLQLNFLRIDGSVNINERASILEQFNDPKTDLDGLLLTTKAGGFGLNLTAASRVILLDPTWTPASDQQAADRVYRMNQTKPVIIYRFFTAGALEDHMFRLQTLKKALSLSTVDNQECVANYFSAEDLRHIFTLNENKMETKNLLECENSLDSDNDHMNKTLRKDLGDDDEIFNNYIFSSLSSLFSQKKQKNENSNQNRLEIGKANCNEPSEKGKDISKTEVKEETPAEIENDIKIPKKNSITKNIL